MKRCPSCNRTYTDASLNFCLEDGTPLINETAAGGDPNATVQYTTRDTNPPATQIYSQPPATPHATPPAAPVSRPPAPAPPTPQLKPSPQWSPPPASLPGVPASKKSGAVWWIIGGVVVVGVIGVGLIVMLIVLASMNSNNNSNNGNNNGRVVNRNANANSNSSPSNLSNVNSDANLPALVSDDFSDQKWSTGNFSFGDIWYDNDEYHMRAKEQSYLVMYAPSKEYNTGNATVKVTVHSVDGSASPTGYGLIVHGEKSKEGELEDYALLIYTGDNPKYEVIKHKGGKQTTLVPWAASSAIRTGTDTNQLEVRASGGELTFYINGQYLERMNDDENFKRGLAGFYTSGPTEVAFDNLEIKR